MGKWLDRIRLKLKEVKDPELHRRLKWAVEEIHAAFLRGIPLARLRPAMRQVEEGEVPRIY